MQLLISVVDAAEVAAAVAGGAAIVDVKNPAEGSLGAPFPHVIRTVREATPERLPVSAAIGDAPDLPGMAALAAAGAAACGVQYVKVGLLGPGKPPEAERLLGAVCRAARERDPDVRIMAATYADAALVGALPPLDLPAVAAAAGADGCMLDTARKGNGSTLFTALETAGLERFVAACRHEGLTCALAGSLRAADLEAVAALGPDIVGFRGAACGGDRVNGRVDAAAVRRLSAGLAAA